MFTITTERAEDGPVIDFLLDRAFGPERQAKLSYSYRDGVAPLAHLSLVARANSHGSLVGSIRYWPVAVGPRQSPALLLGPLAVEPLLAGQGIGRALIGQSLDMAAWARHRLVLLVGDESYYGRFGFRPVAAQGIVMPGENPARLLGLELVSGALAQTAGSLRPWRSLRGGPDRLGRQAA